MHFPIQYFFQKTENKLTVTIIQSLMEKNSGTRHSTTTSIKFRSCKKENKKWNILNYVAWLLFTNERTKDWMNEWANDRNGMEIVAAGQLEPALNPPAGGGGGGVGDYRWQWQNDWKMWKLVREDDQLVGWKEKCNFIFMQIKRRTLQKLCTLLFLWCLSNFFLFNTYVYTKADHT